jgi:hypothetical protein
MLDHSQLVLLDETRAPREQFVRPIYLSLLHANFIRRPARDPEIIRSQIVAAASLISDQQISKLLMTREWRGRLVAGWCIGLSGRVAFVDEIAELLIESRQTYAGQGYCVALGLIGDDRCRVHLQRYLSEYLPLRGRIYDQLWAVGALAHIDGKLSEQFLAPELWTSNGSVLDPATGIRMFREIAEYLTLYGMFRAP